MPTVEHAVALATRAHAGQVDKAGAPYIAHPLRVMAGVDGDDAKMVAALHDVVEDCGWTLEALRAEGFSDAVIAGVDAVTRRPDETYEAFVRRAATDPLGRAVKRADLIDNCDLSRIAHPTQKDHARIDKYRAALAILEGA